MWCQWGSSLVRFPAACESMSLTRFDKCPSLEKGQVVKRSACNDVFSESRRKRCCLFPTQHICGVGHGVLQQMHPSEASCALDHLAWVFFQCLEGLLKLDPAALPQVWKRLDRNRRTCLGFGPCEHDVAEYVAE